MVTKFGFPLITQLLLYKIYIYIKTPKQIKQNKKTPGLIIRLNSRNWRVFEIKGTKHFTLC